MVQLPPSPLRLSTLSINVLSLSQQLLARVISSQIKPDFYTWRLKILHVVPKCPGSQTPCDDPYLSKWVDFCHRCSPPLPSAPAKQGPLWSLKPMGSPLTTLVKVPFILHDSIDSCPLYVFILVCDYLIQEYWLAWVSFSPDDIKFL